MARSAGTIGHFYRSYAFAIATTMAYLARGATPRSACEMTPAERFVRLSHYERAAGKGPFRRLRPLPVRAICALVWNNFCTSPST